MTRSLALVLVLPVLVGQAIRAFRPLADFASHHRTSIGVAVRLLILVIVLRAAVEVSDRLSSDAETFDLAALLLTAAVRVVPPSDCPGGGLLEQRLPWIRSA